MPAETLLGFLCVLARVAGVFVFVPVPGLRRGPEMSRVVFALAATMALHPQWPRVVAPGAGEVLLAVGSEAALGITIGLAVGFAMEALLVGAQILGLQAGFSYAAMVNPATEDESSILLVFAELAAGLLFFGMGLDRQVLAALVASLRVYPPGTFVISPAAGQAVTGMGAVMLSTGLRLAFPVVALLLMVDLGLALMGRLQPSLQLLNLAFPAKMLAALAMLAWMAWLFPRVFQGCAETVLRTLRAALAL